ncbi:bifunctional RecB family nuclease/DEAD/DEAH box helicase [Cryobacterium sp. PH31-L1]|uniref:TM0106 family RecB-like putative nuclease n=1 Tax=Cryobacterium sp. PH31-L1 TaxID=3046199 RepID=UPI0024B8FB5F|nr:bifunctional RecB family nuclease/DEAD/DEAH box helicase [Cryobacterium sp. PH31-L1]MDJ0377781.1 TM0106 family RecB-like putative nuclease [Cryobacterium sp. PH31-L1]
MFLLDGSVVTSASDLSAASVCEFAFLRRIDAKLGRVDSVSDPVDAMSERTSRLGDEHEHRVLERYRLAQSVVEIARPERMARPALEIAADQTRLAFATTAEIIFQATFFDPAFGSRTKNHHEGIAFLGFADFIVRQENGVWLLQDTKLARHARVTALLQLVAYAEQLERIGVPTAQTVELLLGDGSVSVHCLADIRPVYRKRKQRLVQIISDRLADTQAVAWGDPRYTVCGRCTSCEGEVQQHRDPLLVAGLRLSQRARLAAGGIRTIDDLAESTGEIEGVSDSTLTALRTQARLQLQAVPGTAPPVDLYHPGALAALPEPNPGDIFFDFEGDPLYSEVNATEGGAPDGSPTQWGLDYLFGLVDVDESFRAFWAHTWAEEKVALTDFLAYLGLRRAQFPGLHVYHYAAYERTHLLSLAARHGVGEDQIDQLLRENVLVDLYPIVRKTMRVGSRSYSIKKLEPLYMGAELRGGEVTNAADSITEYAAARDLHAHGDRVEAQRMLSSIADYNRYDCVSTLRLRDWLLTLARGAGICSAGGTTEADADPLQQSPVRDALLALAAPTTPHTPRTTDQTAAAFAAAAIDYHRREQKSFWWGHYFRLEYPIDEWQDTRDVLVVERIDVERDWFREGKQRVDRRHLWLRGRLAPGSSIKPGDQAGPYLLYEHAGPFVNPDGAEGARAHRTVTVLRVTDDGGILVEETLQKDTARYDNRPSALAPAAPPRALQQKPAIDEWAQVIVDAQPSWPRDSMVDILRRTPPRTGSGHLALARADGSTIDAVIATLLDLDHSYLAIQGPPGTGKTYLGAHVITALVQQHGWKIGVVAQSHAVVENLLEAVVKAGLEPALVGKVAKTGADAAEPAYTVLQKDGQLLFALNHTATGFVVGGTAWDFSNPARVPRHSLDLLVVDEAGQFSLASTIAASVGARNVLLLGDPQQLPQVSQGLHPEPIDQSALGWVAAGHDVLPADRGYFLAESRRMHPAVTEPVSRLSYGGLLRADPITSTRSLSGIRPGVHAVPVEHTGNSISSAEEANAVVALVSGVLGRLWTDPTTDRVDSPLTEADVIVVTPYNAQLALVREALAAAGYSTVRVGTVDKFQGQEAAIAIVTLAASSADDVQRGLGFLILKNRLNVAISRAQWAAYLVYSPALTEYLPVTPNGVAELSAFISLVEPDVS